MTFHIKNILIYADKSFTIYNIDQMTDNPNSINSIESNIDSKKSNKFVENTKSAIRKVLTTTWIAAGSMAPVGTPSVVPASVNAITRITPIASTTIKTISLWTAVVLFSSFDKEHSYIEIDNIRPADILPIIWQIEVWDKKAYEHIEHLRIAEATRIRDMMWKYGAGNHSAEEYQQLMNRLNTGMTMENPKWYNNYEIIWWDYIDEPSNHEHDERDILNTLIDHANFKVVSTEGSRRNNMKQIVDSNPNNIYIFWSSVSADANKEVYTTRDNEAAKELYKSENFLLFFAWWNIREIKWTLINKTYQENTSWDEHGLYSWASAANWKNDNNTNIHLIISTWTNAKWDINQTNEIYESSRFPVWFNDDVLFAWRTFPSHSATTWNISTEKWKYVTSYVNYTNVAMADLCFQMFAEVKDVDELLEMIRNSTDLRDYIRFDLNGDGDTDDIHNGQPETQPLILMNPAWFFQKYLMPTSLPTNIQANETTPLKKWYYHGVVYQIPGAEVNINGQWVPFTDDNKDLILSQNPMNLEWRLNGESLKWYSSNTINGQIIAVDDQWNGLNIAKDFSFTIDNSNAINTTKIDSPSDNTWYTINGYRLDAKPTKPGIYIVNGQKVIIR